MFILRVDESLCSHQVEAEAETYPLHKIALPYLVHSPR